jgi:hypothetical protein
MAQQVIIWVRRISAFMVLVGCAGDGTRRGWLVDGNCKRYRGFSNAKPSSVGGDAFIFRTDGLQVFLNRYPGDDFATLLISFAESEFDLCCHVIWFWLGVARGDEKNLTYPLNKLNRKKRVR